MQDTISKINQKKIQDIFLQYLKVSMTVPMNYYL